jgi:Fe-S cluster assembly iron-binding protein IscA
MLTITEEAATLIRSLARHSSIPAAGGLRIVVNPATHSLSMGLAAEPERADAVIRRDGALLFVSARAAARLSNQTLCADIAATRPTFFLTS